MKAASGSSRIWRWTCGVANTMISSLLQNTSNVRMNTLAGTNRPIQNRHQSPGVWNVVNMQALQKKITGTRTRARAHDCKNTVQCPTIVWPVDQSSTIPLGTRMEDF